MYHRRFAAIALAAALALPLSACGSGSNKADTTTTAKISKSNASTTEASSSDSTTEASSSDSTTTKAGSTSTSDETTTTVSEEVFTANANKFRAQLDAAGNDFCKIAGVVATFGSDRPNSAAEAKTIYLMYADILDRVADNLLPTSKADPAALHRAASAVRDEGNDPKLSPKNVAEGPKVLQEPDVVTAMAAVGDDIRSNCPEATSGTGAG